MRNYIYSFEMTSHIKYVPAHLAMQFLQWDSKNHRIYRKNICEKGTHLSIHNRIYSSVQFLTWVVIMHLNYSRYLIFSARTKVHQTRYYWVGTRYALQVIQQQHKIPIAKLNFSLFFLMILLKLINQLNKHKNPAQPRWITVKGK